MRLRPDIAPPMSFAENAIWLAKEIAAHPMRLKDRPRVLCACVDALTVIEAMRISRSVQRGRR